MSIRYLVFVIVCFIALVAIPDKYQHYIGLFATGWMISDIGTTLFPKKGS